MKSKILSALLSLLIAFALWLYVVTVVSPESENTYHNVPVVLDGTAVLADRELMITSDTNLTVDLKLSGNRTDLNKLDRSNITIIADLSQITQAGEHHVKYSVSYPSSAGIIEVLDQDPQYITIQVAERIRKEVPVRIQYEGSVPESFSADVQNVILDHATVTVTGPKDVVDEIEYASIMVDLTGQTETLVQTYRHTLCRADGTPVEDVSSVTVSVSDIRMTLRIYQIKEIPLVIHVEDGGGLTQSMVTLRPNRTSIKLAGSRADLEKIDQIVVATINLGDLDEDTKLLVYDIPIPEGVTNVTGVTQVTINVKMPLMETRTIDITNIQVIRVPSGRQAELITEELKVKVRGPAELVNQITAEDIMAVVDCGNQTLLDNSTNNLLVTITILGMEGVGPVGEYYATVQIGTIQGSQGG